MVRWCRGDLTSEGIGLALSAEEGFVLSRLDRPLDLRELLEQTGLPPARVEFILSFLHDKGLIVADAPSIRPAARTIPDVEAAPRTAIEPLLGAFATYASERATPDARDAAAAWFRARFVEVPGEAKADVIWETQGAALDLLDGLVLDARATAVLGSRTYTSAALVQRLVRLPSCPRLLLGHLARQPLVRRSPQLKRLVFLHPNLPPDVRRKG